MFQALWFLADTKCPHYWSIAFTGLKSALHTHDFESMLWISSQLLLHKHLQEFAS